MVDNYRLHRDIPPCDGKVNFSELINYATKWKSGTVTFSDLINAANKWKGG